MISRDKHEKGHKNLVIHVFSTSITFQKVGTFDDYRKDILRNFFESGDSDKVIIMRGS